MSFQIHWQYKQGKHIYTPRYTCKSHTESTAQCGSDVYTDRQNYKHIQYTQYRCTVTTLRLALKPSCLKSRVGLIESYLVSIELCACLQYTEQNSHRTLSLWIWEEDKRQRMQGRYENGHVEPVHQCRSTNSSPGLWSCDQNNTFMCACASEQVFYISS